MNTDERIQQQLSENPIILYMKGVPENPECGFSGKTVVALKSTGIPFAFVNVLASPFIREKLPKISKWPTFPQLFVKGELIGGCDIVEAMTADGSLLPILQAAIADQAVSDPGATVSHAEVEQLIKQDYPDSTVYIEGEGCDLLITVISDKFDGLSMVKQQQGVMATLTEPLGNGRLHAVSINAFTVNQWQEKQAAGSSNGLLQINV
ncbi:glutaredoxin [Methyloprofundus sedimenti]|uniref:Glutaredoxin n=1 Tax=Methyloprofundus sedimenti TaxID=1420851 RepID=A0A1V8M1V5_9GAMM|nr:Grx4 family monothiol glutaredoxin [Methyloprofundus sedimenti]OQK15541.1 glutaredoxin [Methyloprofundus sedimenti]